VLVELQTCLRLDPAFAYHAETCILASRVWSITILVAIWRFHHLGKCMKNVLPEAL